MKPERSPKSIGASDILTLFDESKYDGRIQLWMRLTGRTGWDDNASDSAQWGNQVERTILTNYEHRFRHGKQFEFYGKGYVHPDNPLYAATPDASDESDPFIIDAKNYVGKGFILQAHWQMYVFNAATGSNVYFAIFHCVDRGGVPEPILFEWDQNLFDKAILPAVESFFENNVKKDIMPELKNHEKDAKALAQFYDPPSESDKELIPADEETEEALKKMREQKKWIADVKAGETHFRNKVLKYIGEHKAYGVLASDGTKLVWPQVAGSFRYKDAIEHLIADGKLTHADFLKVKNDSRFHGKGSRRAMLIEPKE